MDKNNPVSKLPEDIGFALYQEMSAQALSIVDAKRDLGYNKSSELIQQSTELSLIGRRIINAFYYLASREEKGTDPDQLYSVDMNYFLWLINFRSRNFEHLTAETESLQQSLIKIKMIDSRRPDKFIYHSVQIIARISIMNGRVFFRIPNELRPFYANPENLTYLSLRIGMRFKSHYASNLYERFSSHLKYTGHIIQWSIDEFREVTNTKNSHAMYRELTRHVITPAVEQINQFSDLRVTVKTLCMDGGRKITHLLFTIDENKEFPVVLQREKISETMHRNLRRDFGLNDAQITEITEKHPVEYIQEKMDYVIHRLQSGKRVYNIPKYLLSAINGDFTIGDLQRQHELDLETPDVRKGSAWLDTGSPAAVSKRSDKEIAHGNAKIEELKTMLKQKNGGTT